MTKSKNGWEFVANADCGTGAGGFKQGNTCAGGKGSKAHRPSPASDEKSLRQAIDDDPDDELSWRALADLYEEQGEGGKAEQVKKNLATRKQYQADYVAYLDEDGIAEEIYGPYSSLHVTEKDRAIFPELKGRDKVWLYYNDQGFVTEVNEPSEEDLEGYGDE